MMIAAAYMRIVIIAALLRCIQASNQSLSTQLSSSCLNYSHKNLSLIYADGSLHPVSLAYPDWRSAQIIAAVTHILLEEVLGYSVVYYSIHTQNSELIINAAAGCVNLTDMRCKQNNIWEPFVHLAFEMAPRAYDQAQSLPQEIRPSLLNVMNYLGEATLYVW